jgi:formylglycine-generating enzyme required for sulfatase activity
VLPESCELRAALLAITTTLVPLGGCFDLSLAERSDSGPDGGGDTETVAVPDLGWILIDGGTFMMGCEEGEPNEVPVHQVTVPSFEMSRSEVTVGQYEACYQASVCTEPQSGWKCNWGEDDSEDHPLNCVNWHQAADFCGWVGGRLPSESEWEFAGRSGGMDITYPWGDEEATCLYAVMFDPWSGYGCGADGTMEVCSKAPGHTEHGLCDMSGNLEEWVRDCYYNSYSGAPADGSAWEDSENCPRSCRSGNFFFDAEYQRVARRFPETADTVDDAIGFRCAR